MDAKFWQGIIKLHLHKKPDKADYDKSNAGRHDIVALALIISMLHLELPRFDITSLKIRTKLCEIRQDCCLYKKRASIKATLTRIQEYVQTHIDISFKDDLEIRQEVFIDNYKKYLELQDKIEEKEKTEEADRITVENIYFSTLSLIKSVCRNNNPELNSSNISNHTIDTKSIKLPHVKIPTFSGQVEEWNSFVDLFTSLIHNNDSLTDVQRFYYLKGFLKEEPLNLVNNLRLISENYKVAWDILKKRYDNEFIIINAHIIAILDAPIITKGNACNLREFLTNIRQHLNSLHALKLPVDKWDVILVCILTKKLDYQTHKAYELEKSKTDLPTINEFLNIVERHCIALEIVSAPASNHNQFKSKQQRSFINSNSAPSNKFAVKTCEFCNNKNHSIYQCFKFKNLLSKEKEDYINKNSMCYNCLKKGHTIAQCRSDGCRICNKKHHTQLHQPEHKSGEVNAQSNQVAKHAMPNTYQGDDQSHPLAAGNATALLTQNNNRSQILLATAQVNVVASNGNLIPARALLDSGSQTSFITTKIFKRLNLRAYHQNIQILGLSSSQVNVNKMVDITIQSRTTNYSAKLSCAILENITFDLPHYSVNRNKYKIPFQLTLADPEYHTPAPIDLLIGADLFFELMLADTKVLGVNLPILQNTKLGYIVSGQAPSTFVHHVASTFCSTSTNDVDENISRFWQLEEVSSKQMLSPQERLCEKSFIRNTILSNGQYTVHLPFVNDTARLLLGGSFNTALRRFYSLERRLMKDSQLYIESITLLTVTYGTSAAPFLATRCLIKLANDEIANYPVASAALLSDTYVDDILSGSNTMTGFIDLKSQLIDLLALAGFKLHKWFSNEPSVISDVTSVSTNDTNVNITDNDLSVKTLGLSWSPMSDHFQFSSPQNSYITDCTKRNVLSFIGKIFDPLGLVGPIVVQGKLLLQQIWARKLNWDDVLPLDILKEWLKFETNILQMNNIHIPRWLFAHGSVTAVELHAFSDSSQKAEIQELTYNCHWLHVKTKENPSDLLSRGTDPTALQNATIWWKGPEWLNNYNTKFIQNATFDLDYLVPEQRKIASHLSREIDQDFSRFSNFSRLQRAVAYCFRFAHNAHPKNTKLSGSLTAEELNQAHDAVIRIVQRQSFMKEITLLTKGLELTKSSIKTLNSFLDKNGLLRISSRLHNADINFDQKYPLILPQGHHVTNLIISHTHSSLLHAGAHAILSHLRLRYWPLNGKRQVKKIINKCVICFRHKAITSEQLMGTLPIDRVQKNSLVLLKEDNTPPLQWPLARVIRVLPGRDGRVRVVEIKTQSGIYTRPITKLCVLPLD
ncbi:hypothetical protein NQ314_018324 [Rhamnusium bicolor]|uniref:CCHC-type domain-containing protein n=1 Tax=Rhamnusium bicolor TaxID=1586634 RepID=A0AAV8WRL5_9CUCU|nr:hypothetical protein NQ314_018324 [Rhamnusium bicolor]